MTGYRTEQKKILINFLEKHKEESFTVDELIKMIHSDFPDSAPGQSTIYRLMDKLLKEGAVKRFPGEGKRKFLYQFIDCDEHLHMKCTECGKVIHMNDRVSKRMLEAIFSTSSFAVDSQSTVLFGKCDICNGRGER